ncbi:ATP-binding protein [Parasphingorhabdus sp.]|uniref:ATP-binding protein n=1 Tax=Parasphingorhabdus sp. TaxID=2709688 RepID=UPI003A900B71
MPKLHSLRLRFMIAILLWTALGITSIWYSSTRLFEMHVERQYHEELDVHIKELDRLTKLKANGQPFLSRPLSDPRFAVPNAGFYWQITRQGYEPIKSASMTKGGIDDSIANSPQVSHGHQVGPTGKAITYGLIRPTADGDSVRFVIATDQRLLDAITNEFEAELKLWLAILALLLLASGGAIILFGLRPLDRLRKASETLRRGEADVIEGNYPSEIAPLVGNLNAYISSNRELIVKARVQAGNLAHALRTPLAVMTDEAERMAEQENGSAAATFLEQCRLMTQQIEYQLARARSVAGKGKAIQASDFSATAMTVISAMERLHPDKSFRLENSLPSSLRLAIDPVDLSEIMGCLLDNAGKWANRCVVCRAEVAEGRAIIEIADDGLGLQEENLETAFEIGSRFDAVKTGSGLGLAIARDIARGVGGEITLIANPSEEGGLIARLYLPAIICLGS